VIFLMLGKTRAPSSGVSKPATDAGMRGQSLEDCRRRAQAQVLYSVAGKGTAARGGDKK